MRVKVEKDRRTFSLFGPSIGELKHSPGMAQRVHLAADAEGMDSLF